MSRPSRVNRCAGKTAGGINRYGGSCPPSGTHRYQFRLCALDTTLELPGRANREQLGDAMDRHILAVTQLTGLYSKKGAHPEPERSLAAVLHE